MNLKLPHWAIILCVALAAAGKAIEAQLPSPWSSIDQALCYMLLLATGGLGIASGSGLKAKQGPPSVPPGATAAFLGALTALVVVAALYLTGCTPTAAVVPVTPDNQALVASCQSLSQARNALTVGDFSFGIADTAVAGVAAGLATSNPNASKDLGIGATAGAGVVAGVLVLANYYSNAYAAQGCSQVLGPLPLLPAAKPKPADPPVSVTIVKTGGAQ